MPSPSRPSPETVATSRARSARLEPWLSRRQRLQQHLETPLPAQPELVLVMDLDGTLLAGSLSQRRQFYGWLQRQRSRVLQVFATGRSLSSLAPLLAAPPDSPQLPPPHLLIVDGGATVACGQALRPIAPVIAPIEARWRGRAEAVAPLLRDVPGLSPEPLHSVRRLAYTVEPAHFDPSLIPQLEAHRVDCLLSDQRYFDVLPAGVNKGSTLRRLLHWLELGPVPVVTAGDSLHDLALFETGLPGVMVGNAEAALREELPRLPGVYAARAHGCAAIAEGLHHFGFAHLFP